MKTLLTILLLLLTSCAPRSYWQYEAEAVCHHLGKADCKEKTAFLSQELKEKSIPHYIVRGWYKGTPHRWIELTDGTLLEPSMVNFSKRHYKERCRIYQEIYKLRKGK